MCGPSGQEKQIAGAEQSFQNTLMGNYQLNFAEQQAILGHLNSVLTGIVGRGPSQTGFAPGELAAYNTQAIDTTGAASARAQRAIGTETAGRNDSGNLPQSGVDQALRAQAASAASGQLANEQLGITEANYATGRANYNAAVGAELGVSGQYNPIGTAGAATAANTAAFGEANQIQQQNNQMAADIASGAVSLATGGLSGFQAGRASSRYTSPSPVTSANAGDYAGFAATGTPVSAGDFGTGGSEYAGEFQWPH